MTPEDRLLKMERENRFLRTLVAAFGAIGALWLAIVTAIAIAGLMPEREKPVAATPAYPATIAGEKVVADVGLIGTLRVERLEIGDVGTDETTAPPLVVIDELPGGKEMRMVMRDRSEASTVIIETWGSTAHVGIQNGDKTQSMIVP